MWATRYTHFRGDKEATRFPLKIFSMLFFGHIFDSELTFLWVTIPLLDYISGAII